MKFLYSLLIQLLRFAYWFASIFNLKAELFRAGRREIFRNMEASFSKNKRPLLWIHCASLGEFEQGRPVIEQFKREFPNYKILLTFFSPSGYEVRKNYDKADYVFYLPWDTKKNAERFVSLAKPALVIFIKYEFWYHYTAEIKRQNIPLLSVSSIFRESQLFFKSYGSFYRKMLGNFSYFFVQNDESVKLLKSINITNCVRAGDTRFDRVNEMVKRGEQIPVVEKFKGDGKVMVIGSCWQEDFDVLLPFINENAYHLKFIIAPHEITESFLSTIENAIHGECVRYSKAQQRNVEECQVMIIDNIGMLGKLYRYGEFAFVGGAFGKGLHNILEAACYGIPILFGNKNYQKFQEAVDLINRGGAFDIGDYRDLKSKYEIINTPQTFLLACEVTRQYVEENLGATEKVIQYCKKTLPA